MKATSFEAVSQFVIPAKPRETGREPGSRSPRDIAISLDSGSRYAARRSSGMTGFPHYDTVSLGADFLFFGTVIFSLTSDHI